MNLYHEILSIITRDLWLGYDIRFVTMVLIYINFTKISSHIREEYHLTLMYWIFPNTHTRSYHFSTNKTVKRLLQPSFQNINGISCIIINVITLNDFIVINISIIFTGISFYHYYYRNRWENNELYRKPKQRQPQIRRHIYLLYDKLVPHFQ